VLHVAALRVVQLPLERTHVAFGLRTRWARPAPRWLVSASLIARCNHITGDGLTCLMALGRHSVKLLLCIPTPPSPLSSGIPPSGRHPPASQTPGWPSKSHAVPSGTTL